MSPSFLLSSLFFGVVGVAACDGSSPDDGGAGGESSGGASTGGSDTGGSNAGGSDTGGTDTGGSNTGGSNDGGAGTGGADSCDDSCEYGEECVAGECEFRCEDGEIYCDGGCIDPNSDELFCGASAGCDDGDGPNPRSEHDGMGGAGGASGVESAGENCALGASCVEGACTQTSLVPGYTDVVESDGFAVQCKQWNGNVCEMPWIRIPLDAVVAQGSEEGCIDDTTSLRPIWFYNDGDPEAQAFCAIGTGSSEYVEVTTNGPSAVEGGWMYSVFASAEEQEPVCDSGFRKYSEVAVPGVDGNMIWSFDLMTQVRGGSYITVECNWPE